MKKTGFRWRPTLLLPLAIVAAVLLLVLKEQREGAGKSQESREAANAAPVQERSAELTPSADDWELPRNSQLRELQEPLPEKASSGRPASSDMPTTDSAMHRVDQDETNTAEPYVGAASFRCVVPDGGAMLTGGWAVPNGGHTFALISPRAMPDSDGHAVTVSALLFELPSEQLAGTEWNTLPGPPAEGVNFSGTSLDSDEVAEFRKAYVSKMTRVMSSPSVSMAAGKYASIRVSGSSDGVMLGVIAEQSGDGAGIELAVSVAEHKGLPAPDDEQHGE